MAYLYRLILACLVSLLPSIAASYPATPSTGGCSANCVEFSSIHGVWFSTLAAAAADSVGKKGSFANCTGFSIYPFSVTSLAPPTQFYTDSAYCDNSAQGFGTPTLRNAGTRSVPPDPTTYSCPNGGTLSGTLCVCPTGETDTGSACSDPAVAYCAEKNGSPVKTSWVSTAPSLDTRTVCSGGGYGYYTCNATIAPDFCGSGDGVTYTCYGSGTSSGTPCTPVAQPEQPVAPTEPASELLAPPPPGTCPGQINGVTVNVPCNNTVSTGKKNEASNDGSGNTTTKAESRATTCTAAGACSTTVTTVTSVNGGAPVTSTKTIDESKGEFCVGNPAAKECGDGEGSSFGGSCDAGFVCEGDAVQCAHAKETHLQNCKLNKDTPERQLYEASKGQDAEFDNDDVVNVGPSSFSQAPILGAASCISDKSITVMGEPVSLPFSRVCEYLAMLGNVLMAVGFLLSGRIIMRG